MSELPYYASGESGLYGNRLPNLSTADSVSADRQLFSKSANALIPQSTTERESPAKLGSTNSPGNSDAAKTQFPLHEKANSQPPTPVASQNTFYPGCIHIREDSNTISLWHPDAQQRENISVIPNAITSNPTTPGSQVPSYPGHYQQLGCVPIADDTRPNTILYWDLNSPEGEYINLTLNAKNESPASSKENQPISFSPSISPTTSDAYASTSPFGPSCSDSATSPTSPISSERTRLRAQLASARQQRKSLDCDIARLSTALGIGYSHEVGQRNVLQGHLKSQLQVVERQREALVARGERTEILDMEIEGLRGALGDIDGVEGDGTSKKNE